MAVPTTNIGANPQIPGAVAQVFNPDQLIGGNFKLVTDTVTLGAGNLPRGSVLGQITASGNYILSVKNAADGSQVPSAVLADATDATGGAVTTGVYLTGEFSVTALNFDATWTAATLKTALRPLDIFLKNVVSATDPT
jgi:hypothetical protein